MFYKKARSRRGRTHRLLKRLRKANCEQCGKGIRVPFVPEGKKPVYCEGCKEKMRKAWRIKKGLETADENSA
jgi:CxxC-x17-CxxC domain-containing protein